MLRTALAMFDGMVEYLYFTSVCLHVCVCSSYACVWVCARVCVCVCARVLVSGCSSTQVLIGNLLGMGRINAGQLHLCGWVGVSVCVLMCRSSCVYVCACVRVCACD